MGRNSLEGLIGMFILHMDTGSNQPWVNQGQMGESQVQSDLNCPKSNWREIGHCRT